MNTIPISNPPGTFSVNGTIVDVVHRRLYRGALFVENGRISHIEEGDIIDGPDCYLLPGFIDGHVHIESSMLVPSEFARLAVVHGTVGTVSDPHEIANVMGMEGVEFMLENSRKSPLKIMFGAPSCVPATDFETSGGKLGVVEVLKLLERKEIGFLAEMMNYPGVIHDNQSVLEKIAAAQKAGKPIDGHAPGLTGEGLKKYVAAGISTDHECSTIEEALEKLSLGMKILIREGSAARNSEALLPLIASHPESIMLCTDDMHPDDLIKGHIDKIIAKALKSGYDLFDVVRCATLNPKHHYGLSNGLLQPGDPADFIVVDDLESFTIKKTYIDGVLVAENGKSLLHSEKFQSPNHFHARQLSAESLRIAASETGSKIRIIQAIDGEIFTKYHLAQPVLENGYVVCDTESDILKIVSLSRYTFSSVPAIGFVKGFGIKNGAIASTIGHDSHNIIAVGSSDKLIAEAINLLIKYSGGITAVSDAGQKILPLPVAGLMAADDGYRVAYDYKELDAYAKHMGCALKAPFMTLSFLSLLVIPELKISDQGLFDATRFCPVDLFVN